MLYGLHREDRAWFQSEDEDQPTAAEIELELLEEAPRIPSDDPNEGIPNALIDSPPDETDQLHNYIEDMLSGPEQYEGNPYDGTDNSDPGFYSDEPY